MIDINKIQEILFLLPEVIEENNFKLISFKVRKELFALYYPEQLQITLKLPPADQSKYCYLDKKAFYPVPNSWGKQGWTQVLLYTVKEEDLKEAIISAYRFNASDELLENLKNSDEL